MNEFLAQSIYYALPFTGSGLKKPDWVMDGNSDKQNDCRVMARNMVSSVTTNDLVNVLKHITNKHISAGKTQTDGFRVTTKEWQTILAMIEKCEIDTEGNKNGS